MISTWDFQAAASELALGGEIVCRIAAIYRARGGQNHKKCFLLVNNQEREAHADFTANSDGWLLQRVCADNDWHFPHKQDIRADCWGVFLLLFAVAIENPRQLDKLETEVSKAT